VTITLASATAATAYDVVLLVALAWWLRLTAHWMRGPRPPRRARRPRPPRGVDPYPDDLAAVDRMLRSSSMSARRYHFGLRPVLRSLVDARLAPHERADPAVVERLGVGALIDDRPAPDGGLERGPQIDELDRLVRAVEALEQR